MRYCDDPERVRQLLGYCAGYNMQTAVAWCEELGIEPQRLDPFLLLDAARLRAWVFECIRGKDENIDEIISTIENGSEVLGFQMLSYLYETNGDILDMIILNTLDGAYTSNYLKRSVLARKYIWPEVEEILDC